MLSRTLQSMTKHLGTIYDHDISHSICLRHKVLPYVTNRWVEQLNRSVILYRYKDTFVTHPSIADKYIKPIISPRPARNKHVKDSITHCPSVRFVVPTFIYVECRVARGHTAQYHCVLSI